MRWLDSLSGVDAATASLVSDRAPTGISPSADLLSRWEAVRRDSAGFVVEETVDHLLPRGRVELTISVADREGNVARETIALDLPVAARHKVIDLHADVLITSHILGSPDGGRLYVSTIEPASSAMSIVDPWRLEWLKTVRRSPRGLNQMAYDVARGSVYAANLFQPEVAVFSVTTESFVGSIATTARGVGLAVSQRRDELYVGLEIEGPANGFVGVIDLARAMETRVLDLNVSTAGSSGAALTMELTLDSSEERLFILTFEEGLLVADAATGRLLDRIDLVPEDPRDLGGGGCLIRDGDRVLACLRERIDVIPTSAPRSARRIDTSALGNPTALAISPDREGLVAAFHTDSKRAVGVLDATTFDVLWSEPRPRPVGLIQGLAFRSDGNLFFAVAGRGEPGEFGPTPNELIVYLHR